MIQFSPTRGQSGANQLMHACRNKMTWETNKGDDSMHGVEKTQLLAENGLLLRKRILIVENADAWRQEHMKVIGGIS